MPLQPLSWLARFGMGGKNWRGVRGMDASQK